MKESSDPEDWFDDPDEGQNESIGRGSKDHKKAEHMTAALSGKSMPRKRNVIWSAESSIRVEAIAMVVFTGYTVFQ